uniref:Uncharacterized protein n=1 Tax=Romanomermis culicivorax TaxID=13658 RepID=A0A915JI08_ROMCU
MIFRTLARLKWLGNNPCGNQFINKTYCDWKCSKECKPGVDELMSIIRVHTEPPSFVDVSKATKMDQCHVPMDFVERQ